MATTTTSQGENQRRRLPKLTPPNPTGGSSDDTPRTMAGEETARERRRARQQSAREQTPDDRGTVSPPAVKDLPLPPRSNPTDDRQTTKRRKARRRVKSSSQLEQEPSLLRGFEDDVIIEKSKKSNELMLPDLLLSSSYAGNTQSKSAPTPRIYFEDKNKFSSVNKDAATVRLGNRTGQSPFTIGFDDNHTFQQQTAEVLKRFTVHVAKQTHSAFQKIFLFIHGINAGYALWVCVFAYVFTADDDHARSFFQTYCTIALITHLLFYIFLAICMVDVLDRIDPVKFNGTVLLQTITAQNSGPALIFYTVAMVVNLVMMQTEDNLRMTQYVTSAWSNPITIDSIVASKDTWKTLTAVRAAFSVVGWFIVSINAKKDRLSLMIKNTEDKAFYEELKIEQNTVPLAAGITTA